MRCQDCGRKLSPDWIWQLCYHCMVLYSLKEDPDPVRDECVEGSDVCDDPLCNVCNPVILKRMEVIFNGEASCDVEGA